MHHVSPKAARGSALQLILIVSGVALAGACSPSNDPSVDDSRITAPPNSETGDLDGGRQGDGAGGGPSPNAIALTGLTIQGGALSPAFSPAAQSYSVKTSAAALAGSFTVVPEYTCDCRVTVNGTLMGSGSTSPPIVRDLMAPTSIEVDVVSKAGRTVHYTISAGPLQEAYVKPEVATTNGQFGGAVSTSGDTLAVGAPLERAVYVYARSGSVWALQGHLVGPAGSVDFGRAVAVADDTVAVGSVGDANAVAGAPSGAVYVYSRNAASWQLQSTVRGSLAPSQVPANSASRFGATLALSGDTLAVGAAFADNNTNGVNSTVSGPLLRKAIAGAVYVFIRSGGAWTQQAFIQASNNVTMPSPLFFGSAIALSGNTLAVGAGGESGGSSGVNGNQANDFAFPNSGAAYVFTRSGAVWSQQAYLKASNSQANAGFGGSLAIAGDTLAVAATEESSAAVGVGGNQADASAPHSGAVYVFTRAAASWTQQAYVKASNSRTNAHFGSAVGVSGDTLAVGAQGESSNAIGLGGNQADTSAPGAGAAYLFKRSGTSWAQQAYAKASNTRSGAAFAQALSLSSDTLAIGSRGENSAATGINGNQAQAVGSLSLVGAAYLLR